MTKITEDCKDTIMGTSMIVGALLLFLYPLFLIYMNRYIYGNILEVSDKKQYDYIFPIHTLALIMTIAPVGIVICITYLIPSYKKLNTS